MSLNQNLANELKGTLFEFLVAEELVRCFDLDLATFLKEQEASILQQLQEYQLYIRQYDKNLLYQLPNLARRCVSDLLDSSLFPKKLNAIKLTGKLEQDNEGDLLINNKLPLSLKLVKHNAFVNTKSAGIKSFYTSYWGRGWDMAQQYLNQVVDESFEVMAANLHESVGIEYAGDFKTWVSLGHSDLPGRLVGQQKEILHEHYFRVIDQVWKDFKEFEAKNRSDFLHKLLPLMGLGSEEILQFICFHSGTQGENAYQHKGSLLLNARCFLEGDCQYHLERTQETASFLICFSHFQLQIRVKPMNVFTVPALKVNCSVKYQ